MEKWQGINQFTKLVVMEVITIPEHKESGMEMGQFTEPRDRELCGEDCLTESGTFG